MYRCWFPLVVLVVSGPLNAGDAGKIQAELKKFQGPWVTTALIYNGKDFLANGQAGFRFIFKDDEAAIEGNDKIKKEYTRIRVKLDPTTTPRIADITVTVGIQKDMVFEGIYELKDDELKLCVKLGQDRPAEFAAPEGSSVALVVLKREKP